VPLYDPAESCLFFWVRSSQALGKMPGCPTGSEQDWH
jgi:hypothetical protein